MLFIANHPFGVIDGLIMCNMALDYANDFQVVINSLLCQDRDLVPAFPSTSPDRSDKAKCTIEAVSRKALADGVPLILFPSGHVSTADAPGFGDVVDHQWTTFIGLVMQYADRCPRVLPRAEHTAFPCRLKYCRTLPHARYARSTQALWVNRFTRCRHHSPEDYAHIEAVRR